MGPSEPSDRVPGIRVAELVAALSLASDLGMGQPMEQALRTCILSVGISEAAGLGPRAARGAYHLALLRHAGCTADADDSARFFGDEMSARRDFALIDAGRRREVTAWLRRHAGAGSPAPARLATVTLSVAAGRRPMREAFRAHCEVAQRLATRLSLPEEVVEALGQAFERWDGRGFPNGLRGDAICVPARVVSVARDWEVLSRVHGPDAALDAVARRAGGAYDPALASVLAHEGRRLLADAAEGDAWERALAREPAPVRRVPPEDLDEACAALGDFADLVSPHTVGRSGEVAELAEAAAWRLGMPPGDVNVVRRAAHLADLGRVGVSSGVWAAPRTLTRSEWERVRLHPYLGERIVARCAPLAEVASQVGAHHERLDGSGYHRGVGAAGLSRGVRLLAAADVYRALREHRPHRPARDADGAAEELAAEVRAGRLDRDAVGAVLEAAGVSARLPARPLPAALTEREAQVLALLARGHSNRAIAGRLGISVKTVGRHVEAIYAKARVTTRAGATLFASQHGLAGTA